MSIFARKRDKDKEFVLQPSSGKSSYSLSSALLRAVLIFMLSYGSVGGFLEAYDMDYNERLCFLLLGALSLVMSLVFETGKKWITNLAILVAFGIYAYLAITYFWELNSGAYAVINRMYQVARTYLRLDAGMEYSLRVDDIYGAVTGLSLLVGVVLVLVFTIRLQYKTTIGWVYTMTFTLFFLPLYFEKSPGTLCTFFLLAGYLTILILQASGAGKQTQERVQYALPIGIVLALVGTLLLNAVIPGGQYARRAGKNELKASTEKVAANFAQFGLMAFFQRSGTGSGISGGKLSRGGMVMSDYETDLIVRLTPYSNQPVYLKAYTGCTYRGDRWLAPEGEKVTLASEAEARAALFEAFPDQQGRGRMEVENVGAAKQFQYSPYYSLDSETVVIGDKASYTYYPSVGQAVVHGDKPGKEYLAVEQMCYMAVKTTCEEAGFAGSPREIASQIEKYFQDNFTYTLRLGYLAGSEDYITHFLLRGKKGYCSHFASSAVMLLRYMGIPARYVEGYALSYSDVVLDGRLQEEPYEDYYSGYAPLGETALMEVEVSDDKAHAWVEMYVEDEGWIVFDPTPAASEEEEIGDFWSNFLGGAGKEGKDQGAAGELSGYMEKALSGGAVILLAALLGTGCLVLYRKLQKRAADRSLPGKERARQAYRELAAYLGRHFPGFAVLSTPRQELEWMAGCKGVTLREELPEEIYRLFYALDSEENFEGLEEELKGLLRQLKKVYGR